jgi:hypothetical protein
MVNDKELKSVRQYLAMHKKEIMDAYLAEGVAIGKMNPKDEAYAIVVYLRDKQSLPEYAVKRDGISFKFEITGQYVLHT